jgi:hypothetical protein
VPTSLARLFPGHPGLSWNVRLNLSTSAARSVLSMNCIHSSKFLNSFNKLISTTCSPNQANEKHPNIANQPVKSRGLSFLETKLFTAFQAKNNRGEQVTVSCRWQFLEISKEKCKSLES